MEAQNEYWAALKLKYEQKNVALQQREFELRNRLDALQTILATTGCDLPVDKPRVCPSPEESPGFFNCIASIFRPKSPCVPQQIPTKENKEVDTNSLNKADCASVGTCESTCICDPPPLPPFIEMVKNDNCQCGPCIVDMVTPERNSMRNNNCGPALNSKRLSNMPYNCSSDSLSNNSSNASCFKCECTPDLAVIGKCTERTPQFVAQRQETPSIKSMDLYNLKNIQEMAAQQKSLEKQINELEQKTNIYKDVLKDYKNMNVNEQLLCPCAEDKKPPKDDPKTNADLKLENFLLKNELKEMRLEVRQYLEKMEGPMRFKIESERFKCLQMEQKLEEAAKELVETQEFYQKEVNGLKMQFCTANTNVYNLTACNEKLKQDLAIFQETCCKLEDDLMRQKISEGESLRKLKKLQEIQKNLVLPAQSECSLNEIARELSKVLKESEPCGDCLTLPEDLKMAARLLKSLTDMVNSKLPRLEGDVGKIPKKCQPEETENIATPGAVDKAGDELAPVEKTSPRKSIQEEPNPGSSIQVEPVPRRSFQGEPALEETSSRKSKAEETSSRKSKAEETASRKSGKSACSERPKKCECSEKPVQPKPCPEKKQDPCKKRKSKPEQLCPPPCDPPKPCGEKKKSKCKKNKSEIEELYKSPNATKSACFSCGKKKRSEPCVFNIPQPQFVPAAREPNLCECSDKLEFPLNTDDSKTDRFRLCHQVTASKSKDILKSMTSVKALKVKENFPFDVDTKVDVLDRPPDGIHVTTTVTKSGTLEVVTEGPEGVIETTLVYTNSGNINVVTEIVDQNKKTCTIGKIRKPAPCVSDPTVCVMPKAELLALPAPEDVAKNCKCSPCEEGEKAVPPPPPPEIKKPHPDCQCTTCESPAIPMAIDDSPLTPPEPESAPEPEPVAVVAVPENQNEDKVVKALSLTMHVENAEGNLSLSTTMEDSGAPKNEE